MKGKHMVLRQTSCEVYPFPLPMAKMFFRLSSHLFAIHIYILILLIRKSNFIAPQVIAKMGVGTVCARLIPSFHLLDSCLAFFSGS